MSNVVWEPVIGIETHVQLKTKSKLFCRCDNDARDKAPNTTVCPVCLGMPGTLPVLNHQAVLLAIKAGLALQGTIAQETKFDRKNYFYPDLPKGYQITQYDQPIVGEGWVDVPVSTVKGQMSKVRVGIIRAHLEEDAGKLTHPTTGNYSLVDLNRAGTPLLEIVSQPDISSAAQAKAYAIELYNLMRYAEVSEADLYHGNMRFDVNVSLRPAGSQTLGTRTETKNLNSFRAVEKAVEYEIQRQIEVLARGGTVIQETRGWNEAKNQTYSQRGKEESHDYRYFPEPDLPPLVINKQMVGQAKAALPALPAELRRELARQGLASAEVQVIVGQPELMAIYRAAGPQDHQTAKRIANWLTGEVLRWAAKPDFSWSGLKVDSAALHELSALVDAGKLSSTAAKQVLEVVLTKGGRPQAVAEKLSLLQVSDISELEKIVDQVIAEHPKPVADFHAGQAAALGFLVGQVMTASRGQANPVVVSDILKEKLKT
jgi:aspartyl-tRNA(Asn)/glutamyl-tRNA(Gln) amidotransferase subunit B